MPSINNNKHKLTVNLLLKWKTHLDIRKGTKRAPFYVFGKQKTKHIINLNYTILNMRQAFFFIINIMGAFKSILVVSDSYFLDDYFRRNKFSGMYSILSKDWVPGLLSNFSGGFPIFVENVSKYRGKTPLLFKVPDILFLLNPEKNQSILNEAYLMGIPIIGIVNSNCTKPVLKKLTYVIPGNNRSLQSAFFFVTFLSKAVFFGRLKRLNSILSYKR